MTWTAEEAAGWLTWQNEDALNVAWMEKEAMLQSCQQDKNNYPTANCFPLPYIHTSNI